MKKVLALVIALIMLAAMAPAAFAADATVNVSVSVDGKLEVAAQPVKVSTLNVDAVMKAAHKAYYSGGESGYEAGIDSMWNMFLITKAWGVSATPYVIVNDKPIGANANDPTADTFPVKDGDNIIIALGSDPAAPPKAVALTASVSGSSATVTATNWTLDFTTFAYSSEALASAKVIDPATGTSLGTTNASGTATVDIPASGMIAIDGLAAVSVGAPPAASEPDTPPAASEPDTPPADSEPDTPPASGTDAPADEVLPQTDGGSVSTLLALIGFALITVGTSIITKRKMCTSK